jgi:catechol 2,3-dioxygenase-like lactoylglutathione lyase family enzyme
MAINIEAAINYMYGLQAKGVTYSMYGSRTGADGTADCSGSVYSAIRHGGGSNAGYVLSTETLHGWLVANGYKLIAENTSWDAKRGDVTIWGRRGASAGAGGHVGIWIDNQNWIECTAWRNGVIVYNHDARWAMAGSPYFYTYRYTGTQQSAPQPVRVEDNPIKANLELVNLNTSAFRVVGWLLHTKNDLKGTTPFVFFLDENNREIARFKGKWVSRPDVNKVFANPRKDMVGLEFNGATPNGVKDGGKFKVMFRASDTEGNKSYAEKWFDNQFDEAKTVNVGYLDIAKPQDGKVRFSGWHLATNQTGGNRHILFVMDKDKNTELCRFDITGNSFNKSDDVKHVFNDNRLAQANACRFDTLVDLPENVKGHKVYIKSRYASDEKGDKSVADYDFVQDIIVL